MPPSASHQGRCLAALALTLRGYRAGGRLAYPEAGAAPRAGGDGPPPGPDGAFSACAHRTGRSF